jgi:hypothetical protein
VLVFGDSQVFGWGVPHGRRFTDLLEARHPQLEVWNLGVMGYGFDQALLEYERGGETWNADAVVLLASASTLKRAETGYIYRKPKPRFVLHRPDSLQLVPPAGGAAALTDLAYRLLSPLYLPYFIERRLSVVTEALKRRPAILGTGATQDTGASAPAPLTRALLARAARLARERDDQLVLLADLPPARLADARRLGHEHGFRVVAVELPGSRDSFVLGPKDSHWNARAHDRIAELLWEGMAARASR